MAIFVWTNILGNVHAWYDEQWNFRNSNLPAWVQPFAKSPLADLVATGDDLNNLATQTVGKSSFITTNTPAGDVTVATIWDRSGPDTRVGGGSTFVINPPPANVNDALAAIAAAFPDLVTYAGFNIETQTTTAPVYVLRDDSFIYDPNDLPKTVIDLGDLISNTPGSPVEVVGYLNPTRASTAFPNRYAYFFTFEMTAAGSATITLPLTEFQPYVVLRQGAGTSGVEIANTTGNGPWENTGLSVGFYTWEVTTEADFDGGGFSAQFDAADAGAPTVIPAVFNQPVSLAWDGSHLWVADMNNGGLLQKVDTSLDMPAVVAQIDLSPELVAKVREIKYDSDSGYIFASCHDARFVLIVNPTNNTIVGKLPTNGTFRARSTVFDGAGNAWVLGAEPGGNSSELYQFNIASAVGSYPTDATPAATYAYPYHIEQLTFGGGYVWGGSGVLQFYSSFSPFMDGDAHDQTITGGLLYRIDPADGSLVAHVSGGAGDPPSLSNGHQVWNAFYALGSVWIGDGICRVGKWDPTKFEPRDTNEPAWFGVDNSLMAGDFAGEFALDASNNLWMGSSSASSQPWAHRMVTTPGSESVSRIEFFRSQQTDSLAFDGVNIWATSRFGNNLFRPPGIIRFSMDPGSEQVDYRLISSTVATEYIASVLPDRGPAGGGTNITLRGYGFTGATDVTFAGISATSFTVVNDTTITCMTPDIGGTGVSDVVVVRPTTNLTFTQSFRYQ